MVLCHHNYIINPQHKRKLLNTATYIHTHTHTYTHTYIHTYTHTYIHTYTHTYIYTYIHTYIHIHTYIYTHTCTYLAVISAAIVSVPLKFTRWAHPPIPAAYIWQVLKWKTYFTKKHRLRFLKQIMKWLWTWRYFILPLTQPYCLSPPHMCFLWIQSHVAWKEDQKGYLLFHSNTVNTTHTRTQQYIITLGYIHCKHLHTHTHYIPGFSCRC